MKQIPVGKTDRGDFGLPLDLVTQTIAILAKKGAGKSYLASVLVEGLLDAGQVPVILDPTGAWWGLKSSADGKSPAYPMVVFGGEHADLPLEETAGEATARAIVEQRFPAIIDMNGMRKGAQRRFLVPFLETLYRLNKLPLMLVVDEADDICPQKMRMDEAQMVGALEDVVKRGRKKGIGCTLITQRPADLAKQVLTQCEMLVAMRLVHPLDIKAVMEWVNVHADKKTAETMVASLPGLPIGQAWFWAPGWGDIFAHVHVARRRTFDSGATPKAGEVAIIPKQMAQPDLVRIGGEIMASVERAKDNDPRELKVRIGKLQRDLTLALQEAEENKLAHMDMAKVAPVPIRVDVHVPVLESSERQRLELMAKTLEGLSMSFRDFVKYTQERIDKFTANAAIATQTTTDIKRTAHDERVDYLSKPGHRAGLIEPGGDGRRVLDATDRLLIAVAVGTPTDMPEGEKKILTAVAQHDQGCTREQLTVLTGYKKSSRDTYLQRLRSKDYVEQFGERIRATIAGAGALGRDYLRLPTGRALIDYWLARLPQGEQKIFGIIVTNHRLGPVSRDNLSEMTGYKKSSRDTYLQRLASRELIVTSRDGVALSPSFFQ